MNDMSPKTVPTAPDIAARDWLRVLAKYREPIELRSVFEVAVTIVPLMAIWCAAWWALSISVFLSLAFSVVGAMFLVRMFLIQHDCGHGAFFKNREVNNWLGRAIGVLTLTPYDVWKHSHAIHHSGSGNLDKRGTGDIFTYTVNEYKALSPLAKLRYRAYRHPITLFVIGPFYTFHLQQRLPVGFMKDGWRFWVSSMGTNVAMALMAAGLIYLMGLSAFLWVYLPMTILASSIGVWLFYVQHQFEEAHWDQPEDWDLHEAALHGSSHYVLPQPLRWLTANIGVHHIHHLYSRIPYYRLYDVLGEHPALDEVRRLTLMESFACVKLQLWDEASRKLVTFKEAAA